MKPPKINKSEWAAFCDFDGTLVDIAPSPSAIVVPDNLISLLQNLDSELNGATAVISGRSLTDLRSHLGGLKVTMVGSHGAEWTDHRENSGCIDFDESAFFQYKKSIAHYAQIQSLLVEDKRFSIAIHTRDKAFAEEPLDQFLETLNIPPSFKILRGKAIREIKPITINKGVAVERLMNSEPFLGRRPLFIGDDVTDEDAFKVVNQHNGMSIKVGKGESCAQYRLQSPADVIAFLQAAL